MNHYGGGAPEPKHSSPVPCPPKIEASKEVRGGKDMFAKVKKTQKEYMRTEERELLHKQLHLLAEKSKRCSTNELAELSGQMVSIYSALNK